MDEYKVKNIEFPLLRGDGNAVLMQFEIAPTQIVQLEMPTEKVLPFANQLMDVQMAATIQGALPSNLRGTDEYVATPETHVAKTTHLIYGYEHSTVTLRVQTEDGHLLLICFDTGEFQNLCATSRTLDIPEESTGLSN
jgi:hypothetical protein